MIRLFLFISSINTAVAAHFQKAHLKTNNHGDDIFKLGNVTYLTTTNSSTIPLKGHVPSLRVGDYSPVTVVVTNHSTVTKEFLTETLANYTSQDDVFSEYFLDYLHLSSGSHTTIEAGALDYLVSLGVSTLLLGSSCSAPLDSRLSIISIETSEQALSPGPFVIANRHNSTSLSKVYRLYTDIHRTFVDGVYPAADGTYKALGEFVPEWSFPLIPVPSRLYAWGDDKPLAGERVGVKDIYDIKGLKATRGSLSWWLLTEPATQTAPSVERIIELGGVVVGKTKTAQFASAADPWDWHDVWYPENPRGDGWLTCSASSAGSACAIAAYEWLDYALGSDTGQSMRRPAAVAGIYAQRPSQGMMDLDDVMPISHSTDTAGVFSRDPYKWIKFSKHWYTSSLYQNESLTGLPALEVPDNDNFPRRILYLTDYLPMANAAAEDILQSFLSNVSSVFDMKIEKFNLGDAVANFSKPAPTNITELLSTLNVLWTYDQYEEVGQPLVENYRRHFEGRYPPLEQPMRDNFQAQQYTAQDHDAALKSRLAAYEAYESSIQFSTESSCSESVLVYDIGPGGKPSFREEDLNYGNGTFMAASGTAGTGGNICPFFGCADYTIPIGQVPYWSNITLKEEIMPVTVNLVVKRGCDRVLYNLVERLADLGIVKAVQTGRAPF